MNLLIPFKWNFATCLSFCGNRSQYQKIIWIEFPLTMRFWHWKSHWKFLWHWKSTETTLKNIYKGNHSDNPGLSHWNIFLCCSRTLKSHWKNSNHTEKLSALLISVVPRFFSVTLDFQCDFQYHNFIVSVFYYSVACLKGLYRLKEEEKEKKKKKKHL